MTLFVSLTSLEVVEAKSKSRSESVVSIGGVRYYVHTIEKGDTMYSLSKLYGVEQAEILRANPMLGNGLRVDMNIKISFQAIGGGAEGVAKAADGSAEPTKRASQSGDAGRSNVGSKVVVRGEQGGENQSSGEVGDEQQGGEQMSDEQMGYEDEQSESEKSITGYRLSSDGVAPAGLTYYTVTAADEINGVAAAHKMSVKQLRRVNSIAVGEDLMTGRVILVRDEASEQAAPAFTPEMQASIEQRVESVKFISLSPRDTLNVALLLPLSVTGRTMQPFVEFYQGVLLGVESLRSKGRNVVLNLYNTERSMARVMQIVKEQSFLDCELIIGPVYETLLDVVLQSAEPRSVPVVSPLATIAKSDSPVLFQMAADPKHRYDKMNGLFAEDREVTLIEGESNDQSFKDEVLKVLASRDVEYYIHEYEYEHPSLIDDREREAEKRIKEAREFAEEWGIELDEMVIDSLRAKPSRSDLTPLLMGDDVQTIRVDRDGVIGASPEQDSLMVANLVAAVAEQREREAAEAAAIEEARILAEMLAEERKLEEEAAREAAVLNGETNGELASEASGEANGEISGEANGEEGDGASGAEGDGELGEESGEEGAEPEAEVRKRRKREPDEPLHHTLFVLSNDEVEVDRILSALSSAYAAQIAINRGSGRNIRKLIQYEVVANPEWRRYKNIDRSVYFRNKVVVFNSYVAGREQEVIREFDSRYGEAFGMLPSLYSYRGYDAMMIFGEGLYADIEYDMAGRTYQPLQSKYRFERGEERTMMVNTNWMREAYKTDFTKDIE